MREMKDSGVPWIGEIPKNWEISQLKRWVKVNNGKEISEEVNQGDLSAIPVYGSGGPFKYTKSSMYKGEAVLFGRKGTLGKPLYVDDEFWVVDTMYYLTMMSLNPKFCYYLLTAFDWIPFITKTAIPSIVASDIVAQKYPIPSKEEQLRIADFLDTKCAEIDSFLEKTKASIEEYKKLKQSVITDAVTKSIRGERPMKDSGVEWIGEIPSDWTLFPLKHLFVRRSQKNNPIISTERLSLSIDVGITKYADKTTNLDRFKDDFSQYQLAYPDDIVLNSMNMIVGAVGRSAYFGCVSPVYYVIYPRQTVDVQYWSYLLNCTRIRDVYHSLGQGIYAIERGEGRVNTCRLKVPYDDFERILVPIPSLEEQKEIASYLDDKCKAIDSLIASKDSLICELESYKNSIIYEYVTGKKEIPVQEGGMA